MPNGTYDQSANELRLRAAERIERSLGDRYSFGLETEGMIGKQAASCGRRALVIANDSRWLAPTLRSTFKELIGMRVQIVGGRSFAGARPGAPEEDVARLESVILRFNPDCIVALGGGSTIDAAKAANKWASEKRRYNGNRSTAFGSRSMLPLIAVQTSAGSASHLTDLAFVVDSNRRRNHVILSETITPSHAVFDSRITTSLPTAVMLDGAFYAIFRATLAMLASAKNPDRHDPGRLGIEIPDQLAHVPSLVVELIVHNLPRVIDDPTDVAVRYGLALATDLAGLEAISPQLRSIETEARAEAAPLEKPTRANAGEKSLTSTAETNTRALGAISFALARLPGHMRMSAILAPYLIAAFGPLAEEDVRRFGAIYADAGYIDQGLDALSGRKLGKAVAQGMIRFMLRTGYPTAIPQLPSGPNWLSLLRMQSTEDEANSNLRYALMAATAGTLDPLGISP